MVIIFIRKFERLISPEVKRRVVLEHALSLMAVSLQGFFVLSRLYSFLSAGQNEVHELLPRRPSVGTLWFSVKRIMFEEKIDF